MNDQEFKAGYEAAIEQYKKMLQQQGQQQQSGGGGSGQKSNLPPLPTPQGAGQKQKKDQVDIGDQGDKDIQDAEQKEREKELAKERGEGEGEPSDEKNPDSSQGSLQNNNPNGESGKANDDLYNGSGDLADRVKEIQKAFADARMADNISKETETNVQKDKMAKAARDAERYGRRGINKFKQDLANFIQDSTRKQRVNSWGTLNRKYDGTGLVAPGRRTALPDRKNLPTIYVYFDRSGSFDDAKTKDAADAVAMLNFYKRRGDIDFKLFYFACTVNPDKTVCEKEGGTAGQPIMDHIAKYKPSNVVVMTDSDISDIRRGQVVDGSVWLLWKGGRSSNLSANLKGKVKNKEFDI